MYLLIFYIFKIKSVINVEKTELRKIAKWDENKGINAVFVAMYLKTVRELNRIPWYGKILVNENKVINNYLSNMEIVSQWYKKR